MESKEDDYILGIWFIGWDKDDWMLTVKRNKDGFFEMEYRFRYYVNTDPWDGKDKKNWYQGVTPEKDESQVVANIDSVQLLMMEARPPKIHDRVLIRGGSKELFEALKDKAWVHIKREPVTKK